VALVGAIIAYAVIPARELEPSLGHATPEPVPA
jgi:hypothetical protein